MRRAVIGGLVVSFGASLAVATATECPAPVKAAVEKAQPGATIVRCKQVTEDGKALVEVKLTGKDGHAMEMDVTPEGTVLQTEERVGVDTLPPAVLDALQSKYKDTKPTRAEKQVKADGTVAYEVAFTAGNTRKEMTITQAGAIVEEEAAEAKAEPMEQKHRAMAKLPPAVAAVIAATVPGAEIATAEVEEDAGISTYDVEFKAGKGEIEVAADGTVLDVATVVEMKDVPKAASDAIEKAATGATIKQIEKSEVRAEIKKEGGTGRIEQLATPRYVYEAEMVKGDQRAEVEVAPDGTVTEPPIWRTHRPKK